MLFSLAYHWESSSQSSNWLSPSRLRAPEVGSHYDLGDDPQPIRRGGSTRSLQLDYRVTGYSRDRGREVGSEAGRRAYQWERNQSGEWERRRMPDGEERRRQVERQQSGDGGRDVRPHEDQKGHQRSQNQDNREESSSPVYEEYRESNHDLHQSPESHYDTLPPTRRAYEGYPSSPPGLNLHPAQLLPPLRAWEGQTEGWRGPEEDHGGDRGGSGDELERLLNLVSLRARRATRINRASVGSEPAGIGWDGF